MIHRVFLAGLSADEAHSCVGQDGLKGGGEGEGGRGEGGERDQESRVKSHTIFFRQLCVCLCVTLSMVLKPFGTVAVG